MKNQQKFIFSDCLARAPFDVAPKRRPEDGSQDRQVHLGDMDSRFLGNDGKRHGILWNGFLIIFLAVLIAACAKRALPEEKVRGFAKFALNNGAAVSQSGSDEYSPSVIQMGDNSLVLIFGSNRSCGGCSGHNLFIAKSAAAYNNNSVFPAFSAPTVLTITATPLNYANRINFAATAAGNNVRIYLTNAGGTIQVTPNIPADGPYDTTLTTIANTAGQTGSVVGIEFTGSKLYARLGGAVNSFDPANAAGALTAMATGNSATAIGCVDGAITSRYDGFFSLVNGSVIGMSLYGDGGSLSAVNTAIAKARISPRSLTLMQGGGTTGPLMFISGTETGGTSEDLYVVDGLTVWQMWQQLEPKPPGAPAGGGGGGAPDTTGPTVTNVTATAADGTYGAGASVTIQVTFSEPVIAMVGGGGIYLALNSGGTGVYNTGSGTNTLDIKYTVIATQNAADLNYSTTAALTLVGGATIKDSAGNNAVLTLPALAAAGSLGANTNIVIDTTTPVISATAPASSSSPSTTQVSYTLSKAVASGSITWTRTGGTADGGGSPPGTHTQALTGAELNSGAHTNITLTNNPALVSGTVYSVAFNATDAAGNSATTVTNTNVTFLTAPSGTTWTGRTISVAGFPVWSGVAYGNSTFVAIANSTTTAATSPDGITWTQRAMPGADNWSAITYGGGVFVAVASFTTNAATSPDGITWTPRTMPSAAGWLSVTYGGGRFVAVAANSTTAATSPDGITWTLRTLPTNSNWHGVTYGGGTFVAVAYGSTAAATSTDAVTWTPQVLPASSNWNSVTYGNSVFVAVGNGTNAASSPDGITWTARSLPSSIWNAVAFGNGAFVAVGSGGGPTYVANSPDGFTWTARTIPGGASWTAVTYGAGLFAALNSSSTAAATSP